jgi:hypothetical protein
MIVQVVAAPGAGPPGGCLAGEPCGPAVPGSAVSATGGQKVLGMVEENRTQSQVQAGMPHTGAPGGSATSTPQPRSISVRLSGCTSYTTASDCRSRSRMVSTLPL